MYEKELKLINIIGQDVIGDILTHLLRKIQVAAAWREVLSNMHSLHKLLPNRDLILSGINGRLIGL